MSIATEITRLKNCKDAIKTSIINKGVAVSDTAKLDEYSSLIDNISTGTQLDLEPYAGYGDGDLNIASYLKSFPNIDTSGLTDLSGLFQNFEKLEQIPNIDTSSAINLSAIFLGCKSLIAIPEIDTSKATDLSSIFEYCTNLTSIPQIDTSNATNISYAFQGCENIIAIQKINASKVNRIAGVFINCFSLQEFGGFENLGQAYSTSMSTNNYNYKLDLTSTNLNHDSLMNVINNLYDIASKGCNIQTLNLGTLKSLLSSDEIAIATNKGWNVT